LKFIVDDFTNVDPCSFECGVASFKCVRIANGSRSKGQILLLSPDTIYSKRTILCKAYTLKNKLYKERNNVSKIKSTWCIEIGSLCGKHDCKLKRADVTIFVLNSFTFTSSGKWKWTDGKVKREMGKHLLFIHFICMCFYCKCNLFLEMTQCEW